MPLCIAIIAQAQYGPGSLAGAGALGAIVGIGGFFLILRFWDKAKLRSATEQAERTINAANGEADVIRQKADVDAQKILLKGQEKLRSEGEAVRAEFKEVERRLAKREDNFEAKLDTLSTKERQLEQQRAAIQSREEGLASLEQEAETLVANQRERLLQTSGLSMDEAKRQVLDVVREDCEQEAAELIEKTVTTAKDEAFQRSRDVILTAIQRYAAEHTAASTVSTVDIPSDDMKGRVIGREGRNIRAFERATGVDVIVDDTPGVVLVSAFDPVRKEIARLSLERLIQDGRIHPGRIEELVVQVTKEVEEDIIETGKRAAVEANVGSLHRKQIELLGRLKFRTSYGQNVLRHSLEVGFLCQAIADELGLDGRLARRCGLLHDIGKAIDHTVEGGHPKVGADFCRKFNERPEVLNAIEGHHGDIPATSPYTVIVTAADAVSASRPGGRRESLERYIQRLQQLEDIAKLHKGVREAFAIQAGREIRVIVDAKRVNDAIAAKIARDIAQEVEETMTYPGEIQVTVLREVRAVAKAREHREGRVHVAISSPTTKRETMAIKLLCIGDVVGSPGRQVLTEGLARLVKEHDVNCVVVNAENAANGSGLTPDTHEKIVRAGANLLTMGDHVYRRREVFPILEKNEFIVRPANLPHGAPGREFALYTLASGQRVAAFCLLGRMFMNVLAECPYRAADRILSVIPDDVKMVVVDIHAEATSEKVALGWHLDGRVSVVFGTHTHIPTADERILPKGTAYVTDLGMTGPYDSVLGRRKDRVLGSLISGVPSKFDVATEDARMCGVLVEVEPTTGRGRSIERVCFRQSNCES